MNDAQTIQQQGRQGKNNSQKRSWHTKPEKGPIVFTKEEADRFGSHIQTLGPVINPALGNCWIWTASVCRRGYGKINFRRVLTKAHQISWRASGKSIPANHGVLHKCDNPPCVNPAHLFTGGIKLNSCDMVTKGRHERAKLNYELVAEIRAARKLGQKIKTLALQYGVSRWTIRDIIRLRTWINPVTHDAEGRAIFPNIPKPAWSSRISC